MTASAQPEAPGADVVELLLECHGRIRHFIALARRLGEVETLPAPDITDAALRVRRYFEQALPLHVADEEQTVAPRLAGRDAMLTAALSRMQGEHAAHSEGLASLVALCRSLGAAPERHGELRGALARVAADLEREFAVHLAAEETTVFPAIRELLSPQERARLLAELRARRGVPSGG